MKWEKKDAPSELVKEISKKYNCDLLTASILVRRGITSGEDILYYLEDEKRFLRCPFELDGIEDAVERILAAKEEGEKVLVYGDRDADGITSTAIIVTLLQGLGMDVSWRVPQGDDPYGLTKDAVEKFAEDSGTLIITVDCGISNHNEIDRANELNIDVIVTDHHRPQADLPNAYTIIDPKIKVDDEFVYACPDLAGCGVAYKLAQAVRFALKSNYYGQTICLLNTQPANDGAWIVEALKIRNLVIVDRINEVVVPGVIGITDTRLPAFFSGVAIFTWDAPLQKKTLSKIFGSGVEFNFSDLRDEISTVIPQARDNSLFRLKEISRAGRYVSSTFGELDVFFSLFVSYVEKKEGLLSDTDNFDLQLAAVGTIADLMPLEKENRIIVRSGLFSIMNNARYGLNDLLFKTELAGRAFNATDISWKLCPVINSAGRMGMAHIAAQLMLESDTNKREKLACEIIKMNEDRKALGEITWSIAEPIAEKNMQTFTNLAFAAGDNIPRGATGITANRLCSRFRLPACVVSFAGDIATGSLRSSRGYDLQGLLEQCADLFIDWGGHGYAAGFSIQKSNWDTFLERLKMIEKTIELNNDFMESDTVSIDAELPLNYLNEDIMKVIDKFEPYGKDSKEIIFLSRGLKLLDINFMGKLEGKHIRLSLDTGKIKWPGVFWNAADKVKINFDKNDMVDVVYKIERNWFRGICTSQMNVIDMQRAGTVTV